MLRAGRSANARYKGVALTASAHPSTIVRTMLSSVD
jgi:hypothetical protein